MSLFCLEIDRCVILALLLFLKMEQSVKTSMVYFSFRCAFHRTRKKAAIERKFHISDISPEDAMVVVKPSSPQYFFPHLVSPTSKDSAIISVEFPFDALGR